MRVLVLTRNPCLADRCDASMSVVGIALVNGDENELVRMRELLPYGYRMDVMTPDALGDLLDYVADLAKKD